MNRETGNNTDIKKISPIKRNKMLVPLSRDHHEGLLLCWKIRQGLNMGVDNTRIVKYALWFFEKELRDHFRQEEDFLFSLLAADDQYRTEAISQHELLYGMIASFSTGTIDKTILLQQFSTSLEEHIRYEERVLFPYLEKILSGPVLANAGEQINIAHSGHHKNIWDDQFWIKK